MAADVAPAGLQVFLGYAPGVGKSCRLLEEAQRLRAQGREVVVGYVNTRGRPATAARLHGLELAPRLPVSHRGITVEELNLPALLARRPQVAMIDDAAHLNPPGFRNRFRYQDILELLAAGIEVWTAFDVQQIESVAAQWPALAGVRARLALPDPFLVQVDGYQVVDLPEQELLARFHAGLLYPGDSPPVTVHPLFQSTQLALARMLALRQAADHLERVTQAARRLKRLEQAREIHSADRVMVCTSRLFPWSMLLLQYGWRMAGRLNTRWFWVHVADGAGDEAEWRERCALAEEMGAEVAPLRGEDAVAQFFDFARSHGVGSLLVCRPRRRRWGDWLATHELRRLVADGEGFHLHLLSPGEGAP